MRYGTNFKLYGRLLLVTAILLTVGNRSVEAAYDWIFEKESGVPTVVSEQPQGSTPDYNQYRIVVRPAGSEVEDIPMLLCLPKSGQPPYSVVVLLHGHGGNKEWIVSLFATTLAQAGIASLAYDLPDHGERDSGNGTFFDDWEDWPRVTAGVTLSVTDGRWVVDYLEMRSDIDPGKIACMGYSLGSYIGCILTDVEDRIDGLVMNVGGTNVAAEDYIKATYGMIIWQLYAGGYFPTTHAPDIAPRPAWMLNGLYDTVILPSDSQALYDELQQPRKILWYDSGHILPTPEATDEAVGYLQNLFDSPGDLDLDGLTNDQELSIYGTLPLEEDSDGDALLDGDEVTITTDPLDADTDDDGLTDYEEVYYDGDAGYDPGGVDTDAHSADTDNDSISDYIEKYSGSNPLDEQDSPRAIRVNFQPAVSSWPEGFAADSGGAFSPRGFGW